MAEIAGPREHIIPLIRSRDLRALLEQAGTLHGHFCPGVSMGVMSAVFGLHLLAEERGVSVAQVLAADGLEDLLAIVETNSCFSDGIQVVTGCTFGNNALIYLDLGKTAVTLTGRSGDGVRVVVRPGYRDLIDELVPQFGSLFDEVIKGRSRDPEKVRLFKEASAEASTCLLDADPERLFAARAVRADVPDYAPIRESSVCARCGESVMGGRTAAGNLCDGVAGGNGERETLCLACAGAPIRRLSGDGIE